MPAPQASTDPSSSGDLNHEPPKPPSSGKQKRVLIESACSACRKRKSKCDGVRPACSRCRALGTECSYDVKHGETRWGALKRQTAMIETERDQLIEILQFLQQAPEREATSVLHRIRSACPADWSAILEYVRARGDVQDSMQTTAPMAPALASPSAPLQTRLPPISTLFEISQASERPNIPARGRGASVGSNGSTASAACYSSPSMSDSAAPQPHSAP